MTNGTRRPPSQPRASAPAQSQSEPEAPQQTPSQSEPASEAPQGSENSPVASWSQFSQGGQLEVAVWSNVGQDRNGKQRVSYSVTLTRSYRQDDGDYRRSKSLFGGDVPMAITLLQQAMAWIIGNQERSV